MSYKLVSTDFDGTILSSNKKISNESEEVILECKNRGVTIAGITARNLSSVKSIGKMELFDYIINNNGAYIYDVKSEQMECINFINRDLVEEIACNFLEKSDGMDFCTVDKYYSIKTKLATERDFHLQINDMSGVEGPVARINIFAKSNEEVLEYKKYIEENYKNVDVIIMQDTDTKSNKKWVSINPKGCNKFNTLKKLVLKLGISISDTIFFGDGTNDIELIKNAGLGIAMGNALYEIKNVADDITDTNDNNGVAVYLKKLLSENKI